MKQRRVPAVRIEFTDEEIAAVNEVLRRGHVVQGQEVSAFEEEFSRIVGNRRSVAVNSGTSALHLSLLASGVGPGDEVIVPSFSFAATANAVAMTGARPVFADIQPESFCLDPDAVAELITPRTRAVIAVHLYGHVAQMSELRELSSENSLILIEDAAQAHGAAYNGVSAGALGDLAAFSFYATKNLNTGEGGMVVCADDEAARTVRLLRNQGMEKPYHNEVVGLNNRMTEIAAAIGRIQLGLLEHRNQRRREVATRYGNGLDGVVLPTVAPSVTHAFHQYTVRCSDRDRVVEGLKSAGVDARIYYPVPIHRLHPYRSPDHRLPVTERAVSEVFSLPIGPWMSDADVDYVITTTNRVLREVT